MDEKDKTIQDLRRENEKLKSWVEELEAFTDWMKEEGFGPEQFQKIMAEYFKDKGKS